METRRKKQQRGFHYEAQPGFYDVKGTFDAAARNNQEVKDVTRALEKAGFFGAGKRVDVAPPETPPLSDEARQAIQERFNTLTKYLDEHGVYAGTGHKRIIIPKSKLTEDDLKHLGFESVLAAIPEAGQDRFRSYRHPDNLYHLHSHPDAWTIHQDAHPSATMLAKKKGKVRAYIEGTPHVATEGIPGLAYYLGGQLRGRKSTAEIVRKQLKPQALELIHGMPDSPTYVPPQPAVDAVKHAAEQAALAQFGLLRRKDDAKDPASQLADIFQTHDFGVGPSAPDETRRGRNKSHVLAGSTPEYDKTAAERGALRVGLDVLKNLGKATGAGARHGTSEMRSLYRRLHDAGAGPVGAAIPAMLHGGFEGIGAFHDNKGFRNLAAVGAAGLAVYGGKKLYDQHLSHHVQHAREAYRQHQTRRQHQQLMQQLEGAPADPDEGFF